MAQRLTFDTNSLYNKISVFDTMYAPDKLYDYSNYITIYGKDNKLYFEMCVILDGASSDAMVRLTEKTTLDDFSPLVINFTELRSIIKSIKTDEVHFDLDDKSLTITNGKTTHLTETSTVTIPLKISSTLDDFFKENAGGMVDFNLLKLYNNMSEIGANLTINTLKSSLYGIMSSPNYLVSTDGFSMAIQTDGQLPEPFMFPKHSLRILKMLPKLGAKYAIKDHRIFIKGEGYECYIGEWSGYKDYPLKAIDKYVEMSLTPIRDGLGALEAIKQCHQFDDVIEVYFGLGIAKNKKGTHKETFEPTPELGDSPMYIHRNVLNTIEDLEEFTVDLNRGMGKIIAGTRLHVFMAMRELREDEDDE